MRIIDGPRDYWAVVSMSLRDDDTWDVISRHGSLDKAREYVHEVQGRSGSSS